MKKLILTLAVLLIPASVMAAYIGNVILRDKDGIFPCVDHFTGALSFITRDHMAIHSGNSYLASSVGNDTEVNISFTTTSLMEHCTVEWGSESLATLKIYEDSAWTGGTATSFINNDGNSQNSIAMLNTYKDVAFTSGTELAQYTQKSFGKKDSVLAAGGAQERVLRTNTNYTYQLKSDDGAKGLSLKVRCYEY
jgi:hypothetical protein